MGGVRRPRPAPRRGFLARRAHPRFAAAARCAGLPAGQRRAGHCGGARAGPSGRPGADARRRLPGRGAQRQPFRQTEPDRSRSCRGVARPGRRPGPGRRPLPRRPGIDGVVAHRGIARAAAPGPGHPRSHRSGRRADPGGRPRAARNAPRIAARISGFAGRPLRTARAAPAERRRGAEGGRGAARLRRRDRFGLRRGAQSQPGRRPYRGGGQPVPPAARTRRIRPRRHPPSHRCPKSG